MQNGTFIKLVCLADSPWIDEWMTDFATLSYTSTSEIPALSYPTEWFLESEKGTRAFRRSLLVYGIMGSTFPIFVQSPMKLRGFQPSLTVTITSAEVQTAQSSKPRPGPKRLEIIGLLRIISNYPPLKLFFFLFSRVKYSFDIILEDQSRYFVSY